MLENIVACRNYAEELRILAAGKTDIESRLLLLRTAQTFDRLANGFEVLKKVRDARFETNETTLMTV